MATIQEATIQQSTNEIRKWIVDFTNDLPTGVTISAGTATHTPPSGAASTPTVTNTTTTVTAQIGPLAVIGIHYLDVLATYSNGEKSEVRITFTNNYPETQGRSTLADLIYELRGMTNAGASDYTIGGVPYWTDKQMEQALDRFREDHFRVLLEPVEKYDGGTVIWKDYYSGLKNLESTDGGTAIFYVEDAAGNVVGTALYSADYARGVVTFLSNTGGSAFYLYARSFDLNRAAADIWRRKASHYATHFNFATDNMRADKGAVYKQCIAMAEEYEQRAQNSSVVTLYRSDYA